MATTRQHVLAQGDCNALAGGQQVNVVCYEHVSLIRTVQASQANSAASVTSAEQLRLQQHHTRQGVVSQPSHLINSGLHQARPL